MRPTRTFEKWLMCPDLDQQTLKQLREFECEICGIQLVEGWWLFKSSQSHPRHDEWGD
jgi:hypothetical protein